MSTESLQIATSLLNWIFIIQLILYPNAANTCTSDSRINFYTGHCIGLYYGKELTAQKHFEILSESIQTAHEQGHLYGVFESSGTARGCGWQKICAFVNLGAYYGVGIPCAVLFAFIFHLRGMVGVWLCLFVFPPIILTHSIFQLAIVMTLHRFLCLIALEIGVGSLLSYHFS